MTDDIGVLKRLLEKSDLWDFQDPEDQKEALEKVLEAEIRTREIPIRLKEAEANPQIRIAQIEADTHVKRDQIDVANQQQLAEINAKSRVKIEAAKHRWKQHVVWAIATALVIAYALWRYTQYEPVARVLEHRSPVLLSALLS